MEGCTGAALDVEHSHGEIRCAILLGDHLTDLNSFGDARISRGRDLLVGFDHHMHTFVADGSDAITVMNLDQSTNATAGWERVHSYAVGL